MESDIPGSQGRDRLEWQIVDGFMRGENSKEIANRIKHWPSHTSAKPKPLYPRQVLVITTRMCRLRGLRKLNQLIAQFASGKFIAEGAMPPDGRCLRPYRKSAKTNVETEAVA